MTRGNAPLDQGRSGIFAWTVGLSFGLGIVLYTALIYFSGAWNFVANTRLLDLIIKGGLIKYHDKDAGFIDGVANLKYYLMSQDPVRWDLVLVVIGIFLLFFTIKAVQFHGLARLYGIRAGFARNLRTFSFGLSVEKLLPFEIGRVALARDLQDEGAPLARAKAVAASTDLLVAFEIVVFALIGLFVMGWNNWLYQLFWPLVILAIAWAFLRRPRGQGADDQSLWQQMAGVLRTLARRPAAAASLASLSLLAFALEDIAAYFTAMSFTSANVLLKVDFSVLLMGVVGSYIARFIRVTPGGLGQFEWGFAAGLYFGGVGFPECVAIAVLDNFFRYVAAGIFYFFTTRHATATASVGSVVEAFRRDSQAPEPADRPDAAIDEGAPADIPDIRLPRTLPPHLLWSRTLIALGICLGLFFVDKLTILLSDFWLLESLDYTSVFWTNFLCGGGLFLFGLLTMGFGVALPAYTNRLSKGQKRFVLALAVIAGSLGGYFLSRTYLNILLSFGKPFGATDPVFGIDAAFYVCTLPSIWVIWTALICGTSLSLLSNVCCAHVARRNRGSDADSGVELGRLSRFVGGVATRGTLVSLAMVGVLLAIGEWLSRYNILIKDNSANAVYVGASYIDVVGFFTNLNYITVTTLVILGVTVSLIVGLVALRRGTRGEAQEAWRPRFRLAGQLVLMLILVDFGFKAAVVIRDVIAVTPNNPVINLDWIDTHVKATRAAYQLERFEEVQFVPKGDGDPVPDVDALLASPTVKNAPLWPGFTSYLERYIDPQHSQRVLQTRGDTTVYGPTLEVFKQQQKLRTYYDFLGVDTVRYRIGDSKRMMVSAVRELPLIEPVPWLGWFGQRFMLFTHGYGLVMAPVAEIGGEGGPQYESFNIPTEASFPEITVDNERVYYGEGAATIAYSNVEQMKEFDFPTEQDRAELLLPQDVDAGVRMDSLLKRLVFGWRSGQFFTVVFSKLIADGTRVHFFRTPIERLERIAPFLYYDSNPYAVNINGDIVWMVNCLTTSDRYPFSIFKPVGNKSDERARFARPERRVNYVEDSVKATVDAYTGKVRFYQISDDPLVDTWAWIYPDLFSDGDEMPGGVRAQLTYPVHLFHVQFDDVYIYYHMNAPMYFFNMEDMWDDGDEVLGPILDSGYAIRFSIEPFYVMLETGKNGVPAANGDPVQFALVSIFTPEKALNLRAIPIAYQDPGDYGRIVVLQVPKGLYSIGPEQADSEIDQNPRISERISWWNRRGNDVIRGHTTALLVDGEVIYVEPIFIRSQQNPVTQLRRVVVVFRGVARMGETLEEALRLAVADYTAKVGEGDGPSAAMKASAATAGRRESTEAGS